MFIYKNIFKIFISTKSTIVLLIIFIIAIASATFIEQKYDTNTADILIYEAWWFELILVLLCLNFIGNIKKYKLYKLNKLPGFIFHIGFILIIIGSGITRYFGWDGEVHIREEGKTDTVYVAEPVLISKLISEADTIINIQPIKISHLQSNYFEFNLNNIQVSFKDYKFNSVKRSVIDEVKTDVIELYIIDQNTQGSFLIEENIPVKYKDINFSFNQNISGKVINFITRNDSIFINPNFDLTFDNGEKVIRVDSFMYFDPQKTFNTKSFLFKFLRLHKKTTIDKLLGKEEERYLDEITLNIKIGNNNHEVNVYGQDEFIAKEQFFEFDNKKFSFAYGFKPHKLPFSIYLEDFILKRYPGSNSPSSRKSKIYIEQKDKGREHFLVSDNKVLDYKGYRFFQLSYDDDEKGTILSVNYDLPGTVVTYSGYFLISLGLFLIIFFENTRFRQLINEITNKEI